MNKKTTSIVNNIIGIFLALFASVLIYKFIDKNSGLISLNTYHLSSELISNTSSPNLGTSIRGELFAKHPSLSRIIIYLYVPNELNRTDIIFRIKEAAQEDWLFEKTFIGDDLISSSPAIFDFPKMNDSRDKKYVFEIMASDTNIVNNPSVSVKNDLPITTRYSYSLSSLLKEERLLWFFWNKIIDLMQIPNLLAFTLISLSPSIFYFLISKNNRWFALIFSGSIFYFFVDIFVLKQSIPLAQVLILLMWLISFIKCHIDHKVTGVISFLMVILVAFLANFENLGLTDRVASWAYLFLFITVIDYLINSILKRKNPIGMVKMYSLSIKQTKELIEYIPPIVWNFILFFSGIYLIVKNVNFTKHSIYFYKNFFADNQMKEFVSTTGNYLLVVYLIFILSTYILIKSKNSSKKLLLIVFLYLLLKSQGFVFGETTKSFSSNVVLWKINPERATLWDQVKITGRNFKERPFTGKILINGVDHSIIIWKDNQIVFQADPTKTKSGKLKVIDVNGKESNEIDFQYYNLTTGELIK